MDVDRSRRRDESRHRSDRRDKERRRSRSRSKERRRERSRDREREAGSSRHDRRDRDDYRRDKEKSRSRKRSKSRSPTRRSKDKRSKRSVSSSSAASSPDYAYSSDDEQAKLKVKDTTEKIQQEEMARLKATDEDREKERLKKKKEKEMMKAMETPEQKRLRRLAKKEAKERKRKQAMGWDDEYMGYTNTDNPFGDANLHQTFVWGKKYEKLGVKEINLEDVERENRMKLEETKRELEKVKQRRLEREKEREEHQEEMNRSQREKEMVQFKEWEKQEDGFHLRQAKLRSKLRIKEGRAKPIDILARYFDVFGEKDEPLTEEEQKKEDLERETDHYCSVEMREPYKCLNGLRVSDLEDLLADIVVYMELDSRKNEVHWKDMQVIVEDELAKLKNYGAKSVERREGINVAVSHEVTSIFENKTPGQLAALKNQIELKISSGEEGIDISYWETLLSKLKAHMARARLRERHQENLERRLKELREKQGLKHKPRVKEEEKSEIEESESGEGTSAAEEPVAGPSGEQLESVPEETQQELDDEELEESVPYDRLADAKEAYAAGGYSPKYLPFSQVDNSALLIEDGDDVKALIAHRTRIMHAPKQIHKPAMSVEELAFEKEAKKGMDKDECMFSVEEVIRQDKSVQSWAEKYRPRKPRYFNRVHTGFEWNKYNQTHYDVDNPPPKVVQGYKFNIFYPDLIDKQKTPQYTITVCGDNREFSIIKFKAGPPYEDIAFKIVNREWNYSYKSGFRCQFHNNILQLWFHFKRYRYRR